MKPAKAKSGVRIVIAAAGRKIEAARHEQTMPPITINPNRLGGTPTIAGTRLPVVTLLDYLNDEQAIGKFKLDFPGITDEQIQAVVERIREALEAGWLAEQVLIAKWLATEPDILILDEPTVGVDIGTKGEIVGIIRRLADAGKAIIVISSELPELLAVSDRILVLRGGTVTRVVDRADIDSHIAEGDEVRIGVAEEILNRIIQGESQIVGTGPHGEAATPASQVTLSNDEIDRIRAMNATAAISFHYTASDWSRAQLDGLQTQFAKMGISVVAVTDAGFVAARQVADIESVLARKPNIIVAIPADATLTADAFKKAAASGAKLVFMDQVPQGMQAGRDYISVVSADNYGCGEATAYMMAESLGGRGKVGVVFHTADLFAARQRHEAFKAVITTRYPEIQIVAEEGVAGPNLTADAETDPGALGGPATSPWCSSRTEYGERREAL